MAAAVLSVERLEDGRCGDIRIVRANALYKKIMGEGYRDNMVYTDLIPREPNFEDFCFRCAVEKLHLHAYVDTKSLGLWTDGTYIPLSSEVDSGNIFHLLFFFEFTQGFVAEKMSDVSVSTAPFVIQTCINLRGAVNFYEGMSTVIADIQKNTDSFCSCIIMIDREKMRYAPLCAKFRDDSATIDDFMPYLTPEVVFSWEDTLKMRDDIIIKDEFDMEELEKLNPVWGKSLRDGGVKTLVLVPLTQGKKMFGVLFITNFSVGRIVEMKEFIELTAFFLSSEIANNDMMERLEYLSNVDSLTGVRNRNSMNTRIDWHIDGRARIRAPFGVIFADLNGLKKCNDSGGHAAGDRLLKSAAAALTRLFENDEVYRSGGDEFVVIVPSCGEREFAGRVDALRAECGFGAPVCFAVGSSWSEDGADLRACMSRADGSMYADKEKFYRDHPEVARR